MTTCGEEALRLRVDCSGVVCCVREALSPPSSSDWLIESSSSESSDKDEEAFSLSLPVLAMACLHRVVFDALPFGCDTAEALVRLTAGFFGGI